MCLGKAHLPANLEVAMFSVAQILKENPKFQRDPLTQATPTSPLGVISLYVTRKTQTAYQIRSRYLLIF